MADRYCPDCERWYETHEHDLVHGEPRCPEGHGSFEHTIAPGAEFPLTEAQLKRETSRDIPEAAIEAAKEQGLAQL